MNVLRVAQKRYPDVTGGAPSDVHAMSRDQAAMGHDVTVLTVRYDPGLPSEEEREGYRVVRFDPTVTREVRLEAASGEDDFTGQIAAMGSMECAIDPFDQFADVSSVLLDEDESAVIHVRERRLDEREEVVVERQHAPVPIGRVSKLLPVASAEHTLVESRGHVPSTLTQPFDDRHPDVLVSVDHVAFSSVLITRSCACRRPLPSRHGTPRRGRSSRRVRCGRPRAREPDTTS